MSYRVCDAGLVFGCLAGHVVVMVDMHVIVIVDKKRCISKCLHGTKQGLESHHVEDSGGGAFC